MSSKKKKNSFNPARITRTYGGVEGLQNAIDNPDTIWNKDQKTTDPRVLIDWLISIGYIRTPEKLDEVIAQMNTGVFTMDIAK